MIKSLPAYLTAIKLAATLAPEASAATAEHDPALPPDSPLAEQVLESDSFLKETFFTDYDLPEIKTNQSDAVTTSQEETPGIFDDLFSGGEDLDSDNNFQNIIIDSMTFASEYASPDNQERSAFVGSYLSTDDPDINRENFIQICQSLPRLKDNSLRNELTASLIERVNTDSTSAEELAILLHCSRDDAMSRIINSLKPATKEIQISQAASLISEFRRTSYYESEEKTLKTQQKMVALILSSGLTYSDDPKGYIIAISLCSSAELKEQLLGAIDDQAVKLRKHVRHLADYSKHTGKPQLLQKISNENGLQEIARYRVSTSDEVEAPDLCGRLSDSTPLYFAMESAKTDSDALGFINDFGLERLKTIMAEEETRNDYYEMTAGFPDTQKRLNQALPSDLSIEDFASIAEEMNNLDILNEALRAVTDSSTEIKLFMDFSRGNERKQLEIIDSDQLNIKHIPALFHAAESERVQLEMLNRFQAEKRPSRFNETFNAFKLFSEAQTELVENQVLKFFPSPETELSPNYKSELGRAIRNAVRKAASTEILTQLVSRPDFKTQTAFGFDGEKVATIIKNNQFLQNTSDLDNADRFSVAVAVSRISDLADSESIHQASQLIINQRKKYAEREILGPDTDNVIVLCHDEKLKKTGEYRFKSDLVKQVAIKAGVDPLKVHVFMGSKDRDKALSCIANSEGNTTIFPLGHGELDSFLLSDSYKDNSIISREQMRASLAASKSSKIIVTLACYSESYYSSILDQLAVNDPSNLPLIWTQANEAMVGYPDTSTQNPARYESWKMKGLEAMVDNFDLMSGLIYISSGKEPGEPVRIQDLFELDKYSNDDGSLRVPQPSEEEVRAILDLSEEEQPAFDTEGPTRAIGLIKNSLKGYLKIV